MDASLPAVPVFVVLLLGIAHATQAFDELDDCKPPKICPMFTRVSANEKYEVREYMESVWMCTEVNSPSNSEMMAASKRLSEFRAKESELLGVDISDNTWPGLIVVSNDNQLRMCWMDPPDVKLECLDGGVIVTTFSPCTVFVRSFGGTPSIESGERNMKILKEALKEAGEEFDDSLYGGAGYNSYFSFSHRNEVWAFKCPDSPFHQCKNAV